MAVFNAALFKTCSLLMLVEDERSDHMEASMLDDGPCYEH